MKKAATICFLLGTILMFLNMTVIDGGWRLVSYFFVAILFIIGLYLSYSAEL
jgi:archaellum biogenesis protein FlaJ (TadC family)